uniref:Probable metal-dependant glycoprotease n=1 Tax=uncultured Nocardioidaceae bacterium TaxID=253824 RepID=A0A6J4MLM6_9ACTN|nr:MAG: probable metal-dependant glycoprotease [uncultured Nocardioidaceae bacterium]
MQEHSETVFTNGRVWSTDGLPATTAMVCGGRITAVGGDDVRRQAGAAAQEVDLAGGLLLPGFIDAHVHPVQGGLERRACDLTGCGSAAECLETIGAYAASHPDVHWVLGGGWQISHFPNGAPSADQLDAVVGDRPAFLLNADHHGAWVNSRALQLAGINAAVPDPVDGRIERDATGLPLGTLHEGAMHLLDEVLPAATEDDQLEALLEAQTFLHSLGITGWQDAIIGTYANMADASAAYVRAAAEQRLTARVVGALWWDRTRGAEQVPELVERRARLAGERFRASYVKIMQDGIAENFTAGMTTPYLDACGHSTDNRGMSFVDPVALAEHVSELDRLGFGVHVHAIGDRAVREALDAFAAARRRNGPTGNRHHIAHIQVVHPDDVPRFAQLDVTANMQPLWAAHEPEMDEFVIPFLGPERAGWQYPFAALQASGARLAGGSDWPVSSPDPLHGIHVAVNRISPRGDAPPFLAEQRLDLTSALRAYTAGSAYVNGDDDAGRIAVGARADLAVVDRDLFALPVEEIASARVVQTYVGGQLVHG